MKITRSETRASITPSSDYFTGHVRQDPLNAAEAPGRVRIISVTFEPGARTAWHTHPLGQTLLITSGAGLVQTWGGQIRRVSAGDVVWFPAGEKHWHGAASTTGMTHTAIQEELDGRTADWLEKVSHEQYGGEIEGGQAS